MTESSIFDAAIVRAQYKRSKLTKPEQDKFEQDWDKTVERRLSTWKKQLGVVKPKASKAAAEANPVAAADARLTYDSIMDQLEFMAHVVAYVSQLHTDTSLHGNSKSPIVPTLNAKVPILGPRFTPPASIHTLRRHGDKTLVPPEAFFLKPVYIVHPFYDPAISEACPQCGETSNKFHSNGWSGSAPRKVHGLFDEEYAYGLQYQCGSCKKPGDQEEAAGKTSFATTGPEFWKRRPHWDIPLGVPHFFRKCAVTRELFDLIVQLRPDMSSEGIAKHVEQLHLKRYHDRHQGYLRSAKRSLAHHFGAQSTLFGSKPTLRPFVTNLGPKDPHGYHDNSITGDLVTDIYTEFVSTCRQPESEAYLRTLPAEAIAMDHTFKFAKKATLATKSGPRTQPTAALLDVINEKGEVIAWRLCLSQGHAEMTEVLEGIKRRCHQLGVEEPEICTVDNCCSSRSCIVAVFSNIHVALDVWHFIRRYLAGVINGTTNPLCSAVAQDVSSAILKTVSINGKPAEYRSLEEQKSRLEAVYQKYKDVGGVWSRKAADIHKEQMKHVNTGCLTRSRDDIKTDGSRIEGTHKAWNSLNRAVASGIVMMVFLGHDFVLRRNIRIALSSSTVAPFAKSTFGSHHVGLVTSNALLWNTLVDDQSNRGSGLAKLPVMEEVVSGESFGLVSEQVAIAEAFDTRVKAEARAVDEEDLDSELVLIEDELESIKIDFDALEVSSDTAGNVAAAATGVPNVVETPTSSHSKGHEVIDVDALPDHEAMSLDVEVTEVGEEFDVVEESSYRERRMSMASSSHEDVSLGDAAFEMSEPNEDAIAGEVDGTAENAYVFPGPSQTPDLSVQFQSTNFLDYSTPSSSTSPAFVLPASLSPISPTSSGSAPFTASQVSSPHLLTTTKAQQPPPTIYTPHTLDNPGVSSSFPHPASSWQMTFDSTSSREGGPHAPPSPTSPMSRPAIHALPTVHTQFVSATAMSFNTSAPSMPQKRKHDAIASPDVVRPSSIVSTSSSGVQKPHKQARPDGQSQAGIQRFFRPMGSRPGVLQPPLLRPTPVASASKTNGMETRARTTTTPPPSHTAPTAAPRPLSQSQRLFFDRTGLHPEALKISGDTEYFLFTKLRVQEGWRSDMTSAKLRTATAVYNKALLEEANKKRVTLQQKVARAVKERLDAHEKAIIAKVRLGDMTNWWKEQWEGVDIKDMLPDRMVSGSKGKGKEVQKFCHRCGKPVEKHPLQQCSDGVVYAPNKNVNPGNSIPYPQPPSIFKRVPPKKDRTLPPRQSFNPSTFLARLRAIIDRTWPTDGSAFNPHAAYAVLDIEDQNLVDFLRSNSVSEEGSTFLQLPEYFDLVEGTSGYLHPTSPDDGKRRIYIGMLSAPPP